MRSMCWGVASAQGERTSMEDEHCIVAQFDHLIRRWGHAQQQQQAGASAASAASASVAAAAVPVPALPSHPLLGSSSFFGIYDGHGGREAAEFVRDHLHVNVAKRVAEHMNWNPLSPNSAEALAASGVGLDLGDAMKQGAADTETALLAQSIERHSQAGAVIAFTVFSGMQVYCAHAGDTRAVLVRDGRAMDLTQDHKPGLESEQSRVAALGGFISDGCVNGEIQVSRALGDVNLETGKKMLGLSADVSLSKFYLSEDDEFAIIGCDGLWDVLSSDGAAAYARHCLQQHQDPQRAAAELVQEALRKGSSDNVSVIIIGFTRTLTRTQAGDGELRVIVPRPVQRAAGGGRPPRERAPQPPPRPSRLHFTPGAQQRLLKQLRPSPRGSSDEEEQATTREADASEE
jgi:serine/threonine protein phosphatase PrpC